jgi:hypothetical protein
LAHFPKDSVTIFWRTPRMNGVEQYLDFFTGEVGNRPATPVPQNYDDELS